MNDAFIQVTFTDLSVEQSDILVAKLSESGFYGFEETEDTLKAYSTEEQFSKEKLNELLLPGEPAYTSALIPAVNWNEAWEKNFEPIVVDDFLAIRADFHAPVKNTEHEIIITPKMSFGTGHHATTYLMAQHMRRIDFNNKSVFDFGTGTGILSILAEKLGAEKVLAIDNDEWSITNANENIKRNYCSKISTGLADAPPAGDSFDIILANINKNVILSNFPLLAKALHKNGLLLLSGLLEDDETEIREAAKGLLLHYEFTAQKNKWVCMSFFN